VVHQFELSSQVRQTLEWLGLAVKVSKDVAQIAATLALPAGTIGLMFYLAKVSAPFPIGESSLPTLLVVLAITFAFVFSITLGRVDGIADMRSLGILSQTNA
jgi:hypothetical protein